jgi:hypothetical protein
MLGLYLNAVLLGGLAYFLERPEPAKAEHCQDKFHEVVGGDYRKGRAGGVQGQYIGQKRSTDKGPAQASATDPADKWTPPCNKDGCASRFHLIDFELGAVRCLELGQNGRLLAFPLKGVGKRTL